MSAISEARDALDRGDPAEALRRCTSCLAEEADDAETLVLAVELALRHGDAAAAPALARRAIGAAAASPERLLHTTTRLWELGLRRLVDDAWAEALGDAPDDANLAFRFGVFELIRGRAQGALARCDALLATTDQPEVHALRGLALRRLGRLDDAVQAYVAALRGDPRRVEWWCHVGDLRRDQRQLEEAIRSYDTALRAAATHPDVPAERVASILSKLADCFARSNLIDEAWSFSERARALVPGRARALWTDANLLPIIYDDPALIDRVRARYTRRLEALHAEIPLASAEQQAEAFAGIKLPFYLHYQGGDMRGPMARFGALVDRIVKAAHPDSTAPLPMPPVDGRVRIGFASYLLRRHTVSKLFGGWIRGLDRRRFEVFGYHLGPEVDDTTRSLQATCDHFVHLPNAEAATTCRRIRDDRLHALIFPELGMATTPYVVAAMRAAPVQAVAWGHPITTGLPEVDLFLSSAAMEPADGDAHYTERLVRLPGLSIVVDAPREASDKARADFGLSADETVLLIPQSLFKLLPDDDDVLASILERVPDGRLVLLRHRTDAVTSLFRRRLQGALDRHGVAPERLTFLPQQTWADYLALNRCADLFLDGLTWSGGMTTLEALAVGLVPVTLPGEVMRARHTAAILCELGLPELIASDRHDYVDIAVGLALDPERRRDLRARIAAGLPALRQDRRVLPALEAAPERAISERATPGAPHQRNATEMSGTT